MLEELKAKQSVMWGNGPYEKITDLLTESQQDLVATSSHFSSACG